VAQGIESDVVTFARRDGPRQPTEINLSGARQEGELDGKELVAAAPVDE
jgi:hypothetical protein